MSARTERKPNNWRAHLPRLEPLNLPLLPCGAGAEQKGPVNHETGKPLTGWPSARFTVPEILAMNGKVRSVGTRTGDGCLCFDIDGGTAIELALEHGCDPQQANTWQVHRTTDPLRLKVLFSLTPEQQEHLGEVTSKAITRAAEKNDQGEVIRKAEALELFHHPGRQVILLGEHPISSGHYVWPDGQGPEALAPIPDCWWQLALKVAAGELGIRPTAAARPSRKATSSTGWQPINPCPICSRDTTSWCTRRSDNGSINCRHGSTFSPVASHGILKPGQTITGTNGVTYAFTGDSLQADGHTFSSFVVHKPRQAPQQQPDPFDGFEVHDTPEAGQQHGRFTPRPGSTARWGARNLNHAARMACFDRCVEVQAIRERNSLRRRARLLKAAKDLGIDRYINRQEIAQRVFEYKDQQQGNAYKALTAADRLAMDWPEVEWLVPDLLPANDLSIIGGRPKVGKTALAMAVVAAVLKGKAVAGCQAPAQTRPAIVITDDQGDADTKKAMDDLGIFDHPNLIWSRRFRLAESDLDQLLDDVRRNPGALVLIDSLRSVSRSLQSGENDPEMGAVIYDLKAAVMDAGGSLLLVHHCNKAAGLTGVMALSGHNAISGAANTVITLHYVEDASGQPMKEAEQRRLVREGRTGRALDWVLSRTAGTASFHKVNSWEKWQEQVKEAAKQAKRQDRQTSTQHDVLDALEADAGEWLTCRQVVEAMGLKFGKGDTSDAVRVREALRSLAHDGDIESVRAGSAYTFRALQSAENQPHDVLKLVQTPQTPQTHCSAMDLESEPKSQTPQTPDGSSNPHPAPAKVSEVSEIPPQTRNPLQHKVPEVSEVSEAVRPPSPASAPNLKASELAGIRAAYAPNSHLGPLAVGSGADAFGDGDDPAWGPMPADEVA
jgi:hypothetical protein